MSTPSSRARVLSLYRRILKMARDWRATSHPVDTDKEAAYIRSEAQRLFRRNKTLTEPGDIQAHIREAESRIELALHYNTPYPRLINVPPHTLAAQVHRQTGSNERQKTTGSEDTQADVSNTTSAQVSRRTQRALRDSLPAYLRSYSQPTGRKK